MVPVVKCQGGSSNCGSKRVGQFKENTLDIFSFQAKYYPWTWNQDQHLDPDPGSASAILTMLLHVTCQIFILAQIYDFFGQLQNFFLSQLRIQIQDYGSVFIKSDPDPDQSEDRLFNRTLIKRSKLFKVIINVRKNTY